MVSYADDPLGAVYDQVSALRGAQVEAAITASGESLRAGRGPASPPSSGSVRPTRAAARVGTALYSGAMAELAQPWPAGNLGDDLDAVVENAVQTVLR